jgi:fatty acid amide hydrolase
MTSLGELTDCSATELARLIASRELSAREVCEAHIERCEQTHRSLNALVWTRFDAARQDASAIDELLSRGETVGPLAGVPVTVKECFYVEGSPACIGLSALKSDLSDETGVLVRRLERAGAVLLGKTNVPQLMLWHECDNPVYGRTNNPWNLERTPGGSTGGEAALVAAGGSALGLGNDLGGSIRIPAAWCGVHGLMSTARRLTNAGVVRNFRGLNAMTPAAGPLARHVADLELALRVLADVTDGESLSDIEPWPLLIDQKLPVGKLRIGVWLESEWVQPSAAIVRAVQEAAAMLTGMGATVSEASFPDYFVDRYVQLITADGGANLRELAKGSRLDWRVSRILMLAGLSRIPRAIVVKALDWCSQQQLASLVYAQGPRSAAEYWRLVDQLASFRGACHGYLEEMELDAIICPAHALPAPQHGKPIDLISAASYSFLPNLLGWPAGVVSTTTVREDEQTGRSKSRDRVLQQAAAVDAGSTGLPVGVQVIARPWREDIVLAVMAALERALPRPKLPEAQLRSICGDNH